jgi:trimethylamine:corrinoid methyltransferase-like protein
MWYKSIYVSDNIEEKNKKRIMNKINKKKEVFDVYCLCLTDKKNFEMEILSTHELKKIKDSTDDLLIVGIAKGKEKAFELTEKIVQDIWEQTQDVKIKKFFMYGDINEQIS